MIISRTPFRLSFFGGGTDYPVWFKKHGGITVGSSIDKYCYLSVRQLPPYFDHKSRIVYSTEEWVNYHSDIKHPAVRECLRFLDIREGMEICHQSDLLANKGLGTSSSFTVGLLNALGTFSYRGFDKKTLAETAIFIEQERIMENVGCQDQYLSALGGFRRLQFNPDGTVETTEIAPSPELVRYLMLFDTGTKRIASHIVCQQIRATPFKERELKLMQSFVDISIPLIKEGQIKDVGLLMHDNWQLKKSLTDKISNPEIDAIYTAAHKAGALGGKILGAGGAGYMLFFVEPERQEKVKEALYKLRFIPFKFERSGTQIIFNDEQY